MTVPAVDTLATYGGAMNNYAPVEDPTTDRDAAAANKAYASTAAMTHTAPRAWVRFSAGVSPAIVTHDAVWGTSVAPTIGYTPTGLFTITWPATITDELGATQTVALRAGATTFEGAVAYLAGTTVSANTASVNVMNTSGTANAGTGTTFLVLVY